MRRRYLFILAGVIVSALLLVLVLMDRHYRNYYITGLTMEKVSPGSQKDAVGCYLVSFSVRYSNPEYGLFIGGLQPGLNGLEKKIRAITFYASRRQAISSPIRVLPDAAGMNEEGFREEDGTASEAFGIDSLVRGINDNSIFRGGYGGRFVAVIDSVEESPMAVEVVFEDGSRLRGGL
ncbi:hypothetical protein [Prevotella sp. KH2C16]|uniref:hypothetical protein n=1 Tax=Prevotella sp. KH2C16 TaxID=1855325 RepID=UPI0008F397BF|nr:hypothetical protein [Prevotella sp. KH2C16]SFG22956.1 hypothetical protein SAMN05216383_107120 [Prevotella sp. KH2C16]